MAEITFAEKSLEKSGMTVNELMNCLRDALAQGAQGDEIVRVRTGWRAQVRQVRVTLEVESTNEGQARERADQTTESMMNLEPAETTLATTDDLVAGYGNDTTTSTNSTSTDNSTDAPFDVENPPSKPLRDYLDYQKTLAG